MKIYKKLLEGEPTVTIRFEGTLKGISAENFYKMTQDTTIRIKWDPVPKQLKVIEKTSENSDVIYVEANLPFPMSNRDFVQERLYLNNVDHAELVKELGLYDKPNKYYVLLIKSTEREEFPPKDKPVRGNTKMSYWFIEEDPSDKNSAKVVVLQCQELKGMIPVMLVNKIAGGFPHKIIGAMLDNYPKLFGK